MKGQDNSYTSLYQRGLFEVIIGDGRPLLMFTALGLILSGGFALFLAATGHFLPHDVQFLGMTAEQLCALNDCRIVKFMIHDRTAFGGALIAIGVLYIWLAEFPLRQGEEWAWWLFGLSGLLGFGSFLSYLGYGYLDSWHGVATLLLLPCFVGGLALSAKRLVKVTHWPSLLKPAPPLTWRSAYGLGRLCLLGVTVGMLAGGFVILLIGTTVVFVPQDLDFMGLGPAELNSINPRLIPLIAHDRAGFGGAILTTGITALFAIWCGKPSRSLWQALSIAGTVGFATAIGVHPLVGYTDFVHLAPALLGVLVFFVGLILSYKAMVSGQDNKE